MYSKIDNVVCLNGSHPIAHQLIGEHRSQLRLQTERMKSMYLGIDLSLRGCYSLTLTLWAISAHEPLTLFTVSPIDLHRGTHTDAVDSAAIEGSTAVYM